MNKIVSMQRAYFKTRATYDYSFRLNALKKLKQAVLDNEQALLQALYDDLGKSSYEAYMCEVGSVISNITYTIKHLKKWMKTKKVATPLSNFAGKSQVVADPYGVAFIIGTWNYPVTLTLEPLIGAIAGGNTCILKLSEVAPHSAEVIAKLINETFNPEYIYAATGEVSVVNELLAEQTDFIFFTGSARIGKIIMQAASLHLTPVCLELGGKSPCIVTKDANLEIAARRIVFGKLLNSGQTCVAPDYIYADEAIAPILCENMIKDIIKMYGENPLENAQYPKIINAKHHERVLSLINHEKVIYGGNFNDTKIAPTIMTKVNMSDAIMQEEIFGPLFPIMTYQNIEEVINTIDSLPTPLALYLFTNDKRLMKRIIKEVRFGGGCINDTIMHLMNPRLPFGGAGNSGMGNYHGKYTFDTFTRSKGILNKSTKIDIKLRYLPYTAKKAKMVKTFMK